jgi:hypothetical protein
MQSEEHISLCWTLKINKTLYFLNSPNLCHHTLTLALEVKLKSSVAHCIAYMQLKKCGKIVLGHLRNVQAERRGALQ